MLVSFRRTLLIILILQGLKVDSPAHLQCQLLDAAQRSSLASISRLSTNPLYFATPEGLHVLHGYAQCVKVDSRRFVDIAHSSETQLPPPSPMLSSFRS